MTVTRLLIGSIFRKVPEKTLLFSSLLRIFAALFMIGFAGSIAMAVTAFALLGTGLAAGFPTMLGIVGNRYPDISATAFSFVMAVALIGNILVNYSMGQVAENYGIKHLTTFTFVELAVLVILALLLFRKLKHNYNKS